MHGGRTVLGDVPSGLRKRLLILYLRSGDPQRYARARHHDIKCIQIRIQRRIDIIVHRGVDLGIFLQVLYVGRRVAVVFVVQAIRNILVAAGEAVARPDQEVFRADHNHMGKVAHKALKRRQNGVRVLRIVRLRLGDRRVALTQLFFISHVAAAALDGCRRPAQLAQPQRLGKGRRCAHPFAHVFLRRRLHARFGGFVPRRVRLVIFVQRHAADFCKQHIVIQIAPDQIADAGAHHDKSRIPHPLRASHHRFFVFGGIHKVRIDLRVELRLNPAAFELRPQPIIQRPLRGGYGARIARVAPAYVLQPDAARVLVHPVHILLRNRAVLRRSDHLACARVFPLAAQPVHLFDLLHGFFRHIAHIAHHAEKRLAAVLFADALCRRVGVALRFLLGYILHRVAYLGHANHRFQIGIVADRAGFLRIVQGRQRIGDIRAVSSFPIVVGKHLLGSAHNTAARNEFTDFRFQHVRRNHARVLVYPCLRQPIPALFGILNAPADDQLNARQQFIVKLRFRLHLAVHAARHRVVCALIPDTGFRHVLDALNIVVVQLAVHGGNLRRSCIRLSHRAHGVLPCVTVAVCARFFLLLDNARAPFLRTDRHRFLVCLDLRLGDLNILRIAGFVRLARGFQRFIIIGALTDAVFALFVHAADHLAILAGHQIARDAQLLPVFIARFGGRFGFGGGFRLRVALGAHFFDLARIAGQRKWHGEPDIHLRAAPSGALHVRQHRPIGIVKPVRVVLIQHCSQFIDDLLRVAAARHLRLHPFVHAFAVRLHVRAGFILDDIAVRTVQPSGQLAHALRRVGVRALDGRAVALAVLGRGVCAAVVLQPAAAERIHAVAHVQFVHIAAVAVGVVINAGRVVRRLAGGVGAVIFAPAQRVLHRVRFPIAAAAAVARGIDHAVDRIAVVARGAIQKRRFAADAVLIHLGKRSVFRIEILLHLLDNRRVAIAAIHIVLHLVRHASKFGFRRLRALLRAPQLHVVIGGVLQIGAALGRRGSAVTVRRGAIFILQPFIVLEEMIIDARYIIPQIAQPLDRLVSGRLGVGVVPCRCPILAYRIKVSHDTCEFFLVAAGIQIETGNRLTPGRRIAAVRPFRTA